MIAHTSCKWAGLTVLLLTAASTSNSTTRIDLSVERGQRVYLTQCAACHGPAGKGDGSAAPHMPVAPSDLTDGRTLNPWPDHFLAKIIGEGGGAVGLSPLMPGWKPFLSSREIQDVIAYIRGLAEPPFNPEETLPVPTIRNGPEQPIFFSHAIHAGSFKIDCQYCHASARRSSTAGIPSVQQCMGCHRIVAARGNPEVQKLHGYFERKESIPWVRIFKLPEYVSFPHKAHVRANVRCQTCHGRIEALERVYAETGQSLANDLLNLIGMRPTPRKLTMGWCVECHRTMNEVRRTSAPLDCIACHH